MRKYIYRVLNWGNSIGTNQEATDPREAVKLALEEVKAEEGHCISVENTHPLGEREITRYKITKDGKVRQLAKYEY